MYQHIQPKKGHGYYLWKKTSVIQFLSGRGVHTAVDEKTANNQSKLAGLVEEYLKAWELDKKGDKAGDWMFCKLVPELKKIDLAAFNEILMATASYTGTPVSLRGLVSVSHSANTTD